MVERFEAVLWHPEIKIIENAMNISQPASFHENGINSV